MFQPALTGSGDAGDFTWAAIGLRWCVYEAVCLAVLGGLWFLRALLYSFKWLRRWTLRVLAVLLLLVILFYAEEDWRCKHAWDQYRREWEAKGEQFDFASFIPPAVPDDQNFAFTPIVASCYGRYLDKNGHRLQPENTNVVNRLEMKVGIFGSTNNLRNGKFLLYSVGWNEKDDGGNAVLRPSDWVDLQQGDWVW
jgi:hypothetical protein